MPYAPQFTGTLTDWLLIALIVAGPLFFISEFTGKGALTYSKFADRTARVRVPSRLGMLILYAPAAFAAPAVHLVVDGPWTPWHLLTLGMVSAHFARRCLEVLFVHRYSGVMNASGIIVPCSMYTLLSALFGYIGATEITPDLLASSDFQPGWALGLSLWLVGSAINIGHHRLLAGLRAPGQTDYVLPRRGLFRWVACPHYLGEIIGWFGFALVFHHVVAWVVAGAMTLYLAGRAHQTLRWYGERMSPLPPGWRRLVPFVY